MVFIGQAEFGKQTNYGPILLLVLFGLILSVIGFLIVVATVLGYDHYITDIVMIVYHWDKMEFYKHPGKPVRFSAVHRWFYELATALFVALFIYYANHKFNWPVIAFIVFVFIELLYQLRLKKYFRNSWYFTGILRNLPPMAYEITFAILITSLLYCMSPELGSFTPFHEYMFWPILAFFATLAFFGVLCRLRWKKYFQERWRFTGILKNDFEGRYRNQWDKWFKNPKFREKITGDAKKRKVRDFIKAFSPDSLTDVRWQNVSSDEMCELGKMAANLLRGKKIVLGADSRKNSHEMLRAFKKGYEKNKGKVADCGNHCTTPMIEYLGRKYALPAVMITASHLDETWQGIKITPEPEKKAEDEREKVKAGNRRKKALEDYVASFSKEDFKNLSLAVDYFEGSVARMFPEIAKRKGILISRAEELNAEMSGDYSLFPSLSPDPTIPENLGFVIKIMKTDDSELGVAFDGDGDRYVIILKRGKTVKAIDPVLFTAISAMYYEEPGIFVLDPFVVPAEKAVKAVKSREHDVVRVNRGRPNMIRTILNLKYKGKKVHKGVEGSYHTFDSKDFDDGIRQFLEFCRYYGKGIDIEEAKNLIGCDYTLEMRVECKDDELFREVTRKLVELYKKEKDVDTSDGVWVRDSFVMRQSSRENVVSFLFYGEDPRKEMERVRDVILPIYPQLAEDLERRFNIMEGQKKELYW